MANHLVSLVGFRQPMTAGRFMQEASYGERGSNHHFSVLPKHPTSHSHQLTENHRSFQFGGCSQEEIRIEEGDEKPMEGGKLRRQTRREEIKQAPVLRRIGLWFLASSVSYALKKAKALIYKYWFNCVVDDDAFNISVKGNIESSLVDAYFAVPVVSATTTTTAAPYSSV